MTKNTTNSIRLGIFVLAGILVLVLILYMVGQNRHIFGASYKLKARFTDAQGLVEGNNVRFSGINVGTVKSIEIREDALIEVTMLIDSKMVHIIRSNAFAAIGTEGLVGNKVINITSSNRPGPAAKDGDILTSKALPDIEGILETLQGTNSDVAIIAAELKGTVQQINRSPLWMLLGDKRVPADLKTSIAYIRNTASNAADLSGALDKIVSDIQAGKGTIGTLVADTSLATEMREAITSIKSASVQAETLAQTLNATAGMLRQEIANGKGAASLLLNDSATATKISTSLDNMQKGTEGFYQNMEALKHNFLFRGYFRKQEKNNTRQQPAIPQETQDTCTHQ